MADPVARPRVRAVEHFLVRGVEHLERRHDLAGGHGVDLELAAGNLADALDEVSEVFVQRQAGRPGGLHLQRGGLRLRASRQRGESRDRDRRTDVLPHSSPPPRLEFLRRNLGYNAFRYAVNANGAI
jgi:hypothetical protein